MIKTIYAKIGHLLVTTIKHHKKTHIMGRFLQMLGLSILSMSVHALSIDHWTTPKGTPVLLYTTREIPMLEINIAFHAGSAYDDIFGQSALTARLLNQGSHEEDANQIADALAETGAQYEISTTQDMIVIRFRTLSETKAQAKAIQLLTWIINEPLFSQDSFDREKKQQLIEIAHTKESGETIATELFFKNLYGNHPYSHPIDGTKDSLARINLDHVKQFYKTYFVAHNAVVSIVGAIDKSHAQSLVWQIMQNLPEGQTAKILPKAKSNDAPQEIKYPFSSTQTVVRLGQLGITHHDKDFFPLLVGNYILGGGNLVSKLAQEVREKRGLTYGVYSQFLPMPGVGPFIIGLSTKNSQAKEAIQITTQTVNKFLSNGPTEEDLQDAKAYLTGSFPLSLASNKSIADILLKIAFYDLPLDYLDTYTQRINMVSRHDIKQAFNTHIQPNNWLTITAGAQ